MINKRPIIISELKLGMWIYDMYEEEWYKVLANCNGVVLIKIPENSKGQTMIPITHKEVSNSFTMMADDFK